MATSSRPPGERDALADDILDHIGGEALQQGHALAQRRLEGDLAAHGALGDGRDMLLQADEVGELVDAFLADHGGVHVGEEQLLAAPGGRLDGDVEGHARQRGAQLIGDGAVVGARGGCERNVGGDAGIERHRRSRPRQAR